MNRKGDLDGDGSGTSPGRSHDPAGGDWGWGVTRRVPDRTIEVADATSCLDVGAPCYGYLIDGGSSWRGWLSASSAGSDGATSYQAVTADSAPFNRDSGTQNKIKFKIDDSTRNTSESGWYTVR